MPERVKLRVEDQVAIVTLARADKRNAIDMEMFEQIDSTITELRNNKSLRAVVVVGAGEDFCTGIDVKSALQSRANGRKLLFKLLPGQSNLAQRVSTGWRTIPCPVIMGLHGRVWGGGLQIALGGDFRIATSDTQLSIMEARWGLIPDMGGSLALREQLPVDVAKYLAMTATPIDAYRALQYHLITEIDENPMERALAMIGEIKAQSPDTVAAVKKLLTQGTGRSQAYLLARESWYQMRLLLGKNQRIKTFNERHPDEPAQDFVRRSSW